MPLQAFTSEIDEEEDDVLQMLIVAELVDEVVSLTHSVGTGAKMTFAKKFWVNLVLTPPPLRRRHSRNRRHSQTHGAYPSIGARG